jgi:hypothetical protein
MSTSNIPNLLFLMLKIHRLLRATPPSEDPVVLLQSAGRDRIPVNPSIPSLSAFSSAFVTATVPDCKNRPSIDEVVAEIVQQDWYRRQIVDRRTVVAKSAQIGQSMRRNGVQSVPAYTFTLQVSRTRPCHRRSRRPCRIQGISLSCTRIKLRL